MTDPRTEDDERPDVDLPSDEDEGGGWTTIGAYEVHPFRGGDVEFVERDEDGGR